MHGETLKITPTCFTPFAMLNVLDWNYSWYFSCAQSVFGSVILNLRCVCMVWRVGNYCRPIKVF